MTRSQAISAQAKALLGRPVAARMKDGRTIAGKLVKVQGGRMFVQTSGAKGKRAHTKALLPLLLFDVAALGAGAGYPYGYGVPFGPGPYGAYGPYGNVWL